MNNQIPQKEHWLYKYRPRLKDWRFWLVQVLTIGIAIAHSVFESQGYFSGLGRLYFVPIILLVIPIIYAALTFGSAGSISTALWVVAISVPNLMFEHSGFERVGEAFQLGTLLTLAVFMGYRVDKERSLRYRIEASDIASRSSELKYRGLFDSSPIAILVIDKNNIVVDANPAASLLFDKSLDSLKGTDLNLSERENGSGASAASHRDHWWEANLVTKSKGGSEILLKPTHTQIYDNQGNALTQVMLRDVTEDYRRQAGLKAYTAHIIRAQEEERLHIARELHDETIQNLSWLCRQLNDACSTSGEIAPKTTTDLNEARRVAEKTVKELRDFTKALRPATLDDLGMVASIRRLLLDFMDRTNTNGQFHVIGEEKRLPKDIEIGIFRIAQEALWNIEHHSKATNADITILFNGTDTRLTVSDNGVGFSVPTILGGLTANSQLGLIGMQERAELFGGKLEIRSILGNGTTINASIPNSKDITGNC